MGQTIVAVSTVDHFLSIMASLTTLPLALALKILGLSMPLPPRRGGDENEYMEALCQVRLVSWDWHRLTTEFFSREELKSMSVDVTFISRKKTLELGRQVTLRSAYLREFTTLSLSWLRLPSPDQVRAEWTTLSSHMPKLRQLDLMEITNVPSLYLGIITDAVSAQRPALEGLHLAPVHESTIPQDRTIVQVSLLVSLNASLSNWAPNLEKLTGIRTEVDYDGSMLCEDEWFIDLATWDLFCQSYPRLVTFHWVVAPFATEFFEAFAKYPKPHLVVLSLEASDHWNWERYHQQVPCTQTLHTGQAATNAHLVLKACPRLEGLIVTISRYQECRVHPACNQEIFGDTFCVALARDCPRLERLMISNPFLNMGGAWAIVTLTDHALRALATMEHLTKVVLKASNVSVDGVLALLNDTPASLTQERSYTLALGAQSGPVAMAFYEILMALLTKLAESDTSMPFVSHPVMLLLLNNRTMLLDLAWSRPYWQHLQQLVRLVKLRHPSLRLRIGLQNYTNKSFEAILDCTLTTATATSTAYTELCAHGEWLDDVFVSARGPLVTEPLPLRMIQF